MMLNNIFFKKRSSNYCHSVIFLHLNLLWLIFVDCKCFIKTSICALIKKKINEHKNIALEKNHKCNS